MSVMGDGNRKFVGLLQRINFIKLIRAAIQSDSSKEMG